MKDLIERQAAIDALKNRWRKTRNYEGIGDDIAEECELYLKQLPSAQPEQSSEIQNILEYLDTVLHPIVSPDHWNVYSELHDMISMLASAQPEIIRCNDCKWCEDADGLMCKNPASWVVATDYDFGCVLAERRQDG